MDYSSINAEIAHGLRLLRGRIDDAHIPPSSLDETINIATWNIREFGRIQRKKTSVYYIAEILNQFDLISVVEVRDKLTDLNRVLSILGPYWQALYTDYITDPGGNRERIAYIYDTRAVVFKGLEAEADAPRRKNPASGEYLHRISWWRKPFIASFRAGDFDFVTITAHIRWGKNDEERIQPLKLMAEWVDKRHRETYMKDKDIIVMGDFNIPSTESELFRAISSKGLCIPQALLGIHGTNLAANKRYDQILHYPLYTGCFTGRGGVLDFYCNDHKMLFPNLTKHEFTFQLSDHLPLWIQINTDRSAERISEVLQH